MRKQPWIKAIHSLPFTVTLSVLFQFNQFIKASVSFTFPQDA